MIISEYEVISMSLSCRFFQGRGNDLYSSFFFIVRHKGRERRKKTVRRKQNRKAKCEDRKYSPFPSRVIKVSLKHSIPVY
jgi:hypothetical protein